MFSAAVILVIVLYSIFIHLKPKRPKKFPPGPENNYPLIGSGLELAKLGNAAYDSFRKLGEIYGDISSVFLGDYPTIIINGHDATKAFYAIDEFSARPNLFLINHRWGGKQLGVFFSNGRLWQEQRRFTIRHLRDFGFGKATMEGLIHDESDECIRSMKKALKESGESGVINISDRFTVSMVNILWAIVAGIRYSHEDQEFKKLLKIIQNSLRSGSVSSPLIGILNRFPWARHLPYIKQYFKALNAGTDAVIDVLLKTIEDHQQTFEPASEPRDLIDVYLKSMVESKDDPESTFFKDQLVQTCSDLFSAGSESTSNSVAFAVLHMLRNPECQEKVHQELDAVVGRERLASLDDKQKLPYTFAVIAESFRMSPVAPISVNHVATKDVKLMGFDIPKDTWALVNYISANMDQTYWGDPENFRPERFLDADGQFIKEKLDHVHGFGAGKRQCLGEPLARMSNFLLFTATMQHFKFEIPPGQPMPTAEPSEGFTVAPHAFSAKVTVRY